MGLFEPFLFIFNLNAFCKINNVNKLNSLFPQAVAFCVPLQAIYVPVSLHLHKV